MSDMLVFVSAQDLDVVVDVPSGLLRLMQQNLIDLTPWHIMDRDAALRRIAGLRKRFSKKYVPFAFRQDNDDLACIDPGQPGCVVIVHDFSSDGFEVRQRFDDFWTWFRAAVDDMIEFE